MSLNISSKFILLKLRDHSLNTLIPQLPQRTYSLVTYLPEGGRPVVTLRAVVQGVNVRPEVLRDDSGVGAVRAAVGRSYPSVLVEHVELESGEAHSPPPTLPTALRPLA